MNIAVYLGLKATKQNKQTNKQNVLLTFEKRRKIPPNTPKIEYRLNLLIRVGKSIQLKWVNYCLFSLADGTTTIYFATSSSDTPAQGMYEEGISIKGIPDSFQPLSLGKENIVLLKTLLDMGLTARKPVFGFPTK